MHFKRWITAIIAIPALIFIIGPGPLWLFQLMILITSIVGLFEFFSIATSHLPVLIRVFCVVINMIILYLISFGPFFLLPAILSISLIIFFGLFLFVHRDRIPVALDEVGKMVTGFLYITIPLSFFLFIRMHPKGEFWIFYLLIVIFFSDTGAFYCGRSFGKHKLYPSVSPGKTWEGAIGGLLSSILVAYLFTHFFPFTRFGIELLALTLCLSILGQIGDLAESMIKRNRGVKDSGKILPGHGGVLDRIDGLLFSIPALYVFLSWI